MNNDIQQQVNQSTRFPLKEFFSKDLVKSKFNELLGKNAGAFVTSVLQVARSNEMLAKATPDSVFNAALMAATLNLPINSNLGFAHMVPFNNKKKGIVEAQFQIGWKGLVQLAQRSGQFSRISTAVVHEGQLVKSNPLTGYEFDWDSDISDTVIGYVAYFRLLNGFESSLYMTVEQIKKHAKTFSQSYKLGYGVWYDNFDAMASKTVLKLLLSKYAPLSIEMQKAIEADQAVINDVGGDYSYIDNQDTIEAKAVSGQAITENKTELPPYPQSRMDESLKGWRSKIDKGETTADKIIAMVSSKYTLTESQKKFIRGENAEGAMIDGEFINDGGSQ